MKVQTTFARVALCAAVLGLAACDDGAMDERDSGVPADAALPGDGDVGDGDVGDGDVGDGDVGDGDVGDGDVGDGDAGSTSDSGTGQDASMADASMSADAGVAVMFTVPSGGGQVEVPAGDVTVALDFPSSAAGKDVVVTPIAGSDVGFLQDSGLAGNMKFVLSLEPDGSTFADPIKVSFSDGSLVAFSFKSDGSVGEPLALSGDGQSLLLSHFSALGVPASLCDSQSPWSDTPNSGSCSGATSTRRSYGCKGYKYCFVQEISCCVDPSTNSDASVGCRLGDANLVVDNRRVGPNGDQYPYCAKGLPKVTSVAPSELVASGTDQTITLTGTDFDPQGSVFIQGDILLATTWNDSTSATATVPGSALGSAGTLGGVGYINRKYNASAACAAASLAQCDFPNKSNMNSIPVNAPPSSCVEGGTAASNVSGAGTCASPFLIDLRTVPSGGVRSHTIAQGVGTDEASEPGGYCGGTATARDVVYALMLPQGADIQVGVDAASGADPQIFVHEDSSCSQPINGCATGGAAGACEYVSATHQSGAIFGTQPYVTVSEVSDSSTALTVRFKLTGTITTPTLGSLTPDSVVGTQTTHMVKATLQNGSSWQAYAVFSKGGNFVEQAYCDPTDADHCDFAVPVTVLADPGSYTVALKFFEIDGTPVTNALPFTVTAP